ncbi:MAG: superoxide dismutase [Oscillospiraceae bacterium]|nr:superoxide dismutase [Oscillospiraceae bacterium]
MNQLRYPFPLEPLPYAYNALEPNIDTLTMQLHHDRHLKAFVDDLNAALAECPEYQCLSLTQLIRNADRLPSCIRTAVKHNAGGVFNHLFFFNGMIPGGRPAAGNLERKINCCFGSFEGFQAQFKASALDVFGSGYAWLVKSRAGQPRIITTANQDTPLTLDCVPLAAIDVWEHAYYLKHYNVRADYIDAWFKTADFTGASQLYETA